MRIGGSHPPNFTVLFVGLHVLLEPVDVRGKIFPVCEHQKAFDAAPNTLQHNDEINITGLTIPDCVNIYLKRVNLTFTIQQNADNVSMELRYYVGDKPTVWVNSKLNGNWGFPIIYKLDTVVLPVGRVNILVKVVVDSYRVHLVGVRRRFLYPFRAVKPEVCSQIVFKTVGVGSIEMETTLIPTKTTEKVPTPTLSPTGRPTRDKVTTPTQGPSHDTSLSPTGQQTTDGETVTGTRSTDTPLKMYQIPIIISGILGFLIILGASSVFIYREWCRDANDSDTASPISTLGSVSREFSSESLEGSESREEPQGAADTCSQVSYEEEEA